MATITTTTTTSAASIVTCRAAVPKAALSLSPPSVVGLAQIGAKGGRVRCKSETKTTPTPTPTRGVGVALLAAAGAAVASSGAAVALVDERMSTEGTGLSLGISNNLLTWILVGVFGIIWALYFIYTSTLEEDEESGLSL